MSKLFKDKKVIVMGLGLHGGGVSAAKFFYKQGAKVLVTDLKTKEQLKESILKLKKFKINFVLAGHKEEDFKKADLIIKNPDVPNSSPYLEIARKNNIPIETDISLFFKLTNAFTIGVTGTKGKSTTASLIFHILKSKFKRVFLVGNIGVSPLEIISKIEKGDRVVLELSSFELEDLKQSPNISVITNILPDHLNRYGDMSKYADSKKSIFKFQNKKDILILNEEDDIVKNFARESLSKKYFYSAKTISKSIKIKDFKLLGNHNLSNLAAAVLVAKLLKIPMPKINNAIKSFKGVSSRQEFVKEINGVKYFNDTTATMPDAVIAAIDAFSDKYLDSKLIFICGGQNKELDFLELAKKIKEKVEYLILLPGTASEKMEKDLLRYGYNKIYKVSSIENAVLRAKEISRKGDIVVLSPGAASFNLFKNEFDRGNHFVKAVKSLK
jgi:UDP-N-acetylmuramoylalanine--D-glutamate ligase